MLSFQFALESLRAHSRMLHHLAVCSIAFDIVYKGPRCTVQCARCTLQKREKKRNKARTKEKKLIILLHQHWILALFSAHWMCLCSNWFICSPTIFNSFKYILFLLIFFHMIDRLAHFHFLVKFSPSQSDLAQLNFLVFYTQSRQIWIAGIARENWNGCSVFIATFVFPFWMDVVYVIVCDEDRIHFCCCCSSCCSMAIHFSA